MHARFILAFTVLAACGSPVQPSESVGEDTEGTDAQSDSSGSDSGSDAASTGTSEIPGTSGTTLPEPSTGSDSTSGADDTSEGASTEGAVNSCECFTQDGPFTSPGCDSDELCDPLVITCDLPEPSDCTFDEMMVSNPELLGCHRDAILAGAPGFVRWELGYLPDAGAKGQRGWVVLQGDGTALFWSESWGELNYAFSAIEGAPLDADATLEACADLASSEATLQCLYAPVSDEITVCSDAYTVPIG